jgi:sugar (pentulose or hexulose) kinase
MPHLLAIDAGTTSVKAGLFSPDGRCVGLGREEYQLETPATDRAELNPEVYWQACLKTVRGALEQSRVRPEDVAAVAVSSQGETTITLDSEGRAIYPALVWVDNRATTQAAFLAERFGRIAYARTGIPEIVPTWPACKIQWIREREPAVFARAAKFVLVQDYLIYKLTGRLVTDGSISCTTLNYDIVNHCWWKDVLSAIGITTEQLPELVEPGTMVGSISEEAASLLGLTAKTGVVTGGMDQAVGAIGAGNFKTGVISESTGAALAVQATVIDPMSDPSETVPVYYHSVPGHYLFVPVAPTAGMAFKWFRDAFFQDEIRKAEADHVDSYDRLTEIAESVPAGSDGLIMLPHLMGSFTPEPNPLARGSFTGFTLSHTRGHFVRALLEGVAFLLRRNLDCIERTGIAIHEIRSTGGGARSKLWNQIKANVCNRPVVTLANEETALLGDAILAGVASGIFQSIEEGCNSMVVLKERIQPNKDAQVYAESYRSYCELDQRLAEYFKRSPARETGMRS